MDFDIRPFNFSAATVSWLIVTGSLLLAGVVLAMLLVVARNGGDGLKIFVNGLKSYLDDLTSLSPRRIYAVTRLTLKEAVRRKALMVFLLFAMLLMFGSWFMPNANQRAELQVQVHVTTLLLALTWLLLPAVIFLSCWALPEDIRIRSLHTVVTKPARRVEIIIGRMAGLSVVTLTLLVLMAGAGLIWLYRSIPAESRSALECRVPLFGELYFLSQEGQITDKGLNVGDAWEYRSHIAGNTRARAIWIFPSVDSSALTTSDGGNEELLLECRFEAFRTVKGSEKSLKQGLQAQYTISANSRDDAFGMLCQSEILRPMADALRDAQYRNAAERMKELAGRMRTAPDEMRPADYGGLQFGLTVAGDYLTRTNDQRLAPMAALFTDAAKKGATVVIALQENAQNKGSAKVSYEELAAGMEAVAQGLIDHADTLLEAMPRLEVPLPAFHVSEYHDAEQSINVTRVPRRLRFVADYETLARFLASVMDEWNGAGRLVEGTALKATLTDDLVKEKNISRLNAERLVAVLDEQLAAGGLGIKDGKLNVASGRSWFLHFDELIRAEKLVSEDSEGWMIEKDLIDDLSKQGFLRVEVACVNDQMYLGMARPDLFIRKASQAFLVGYTKTIISISLMLMLVIVLGVTVSSVVKGPVALFFTLTFFLTGQVFHGFMIQKLSGVEQGMGTIESAVLIGQHRNPQVGMDLSGTAQAFVRGADVGFESILWAFSNIVPDFSTFNRAAAYVENRFDVPFLECVVPAIAVFIGFLIPCVLIAGALLKFRELESK